MDKNEFFIQVLQKLGVPFSQGAMDFLLTWAKYEQRPNGKPHGFNPLNTTWDNKREDPKQTNFNSNSGYPVKSYSTFKSGVDSTAATLKLRYYKNILEALKSTQPMSLLLQRPNVSKELKTWGTYTFAKKFSDYKTNEQKEKQKNEDNTGKIVVSILLILGVFLVYKYAN